uniref:Uncharacterized protein n=1 Tax=Picea sitchensis TaxID=3332 RepID=A0A6B9XUU9_PICSI|nr:hypothetical protein Q903MT_gene3788 [Picea sitchensis]
MLSGLQTASARRAYADLPLLLVPEPPNHLHPLTQPLWNRLHGWIPLRALIQPEIRRGYMLLTLSPPTFPLVSYNLPIGRPRPTCPRHLLH